MSAITFFLAVHGTEVTRRAVQYTGTEEEYPVDKCGYWYQSDGWKEYKARRDNCVWSNKTLAKDFFGDDDWDGFHTGVSWDGRDVRLTWTTPIEHDLYVQECWFEDPDPARKGEMWTLRRVGPFTTRGKENGVSTWLQLKWHETFTQRYFTGRAFARYEGTMDEPQHTGFPLGSPPIHVHHEHLSYTEGLPDFVPLLQSMNVNRIGACHGEQHGFGEEGALLNVYKSLPLGTGKPMGKHTYDNKLADTRDEGASPLSWFQEIGLRTTPVEQKKIYHLTRFNQGSLFNNIQLVVPENAVSMFWLTFSMPATGHMITTWMHTHGLNRILVFKGDAAGAFLREHYAKPMDSKMLTLSDTVENVADDLHARAKAAGIEVCEGTPQFEEVEYPEHTGQVTHTRITKICCLPWEFKKGDGAVALGLYDSKEAKIPLKQHFVFRGEYMIDEDAPENQFTKDEEKELFINNLQFCGEHAEGCIKTVTTGLKLSSVIWAQGHLLPDTPFNRVIGWICLALIGSIIIALIYVCIRKCCCKKSDYQKVGESPNHKLIDWAENANAEKRVLV